MFRAKPDIKTTVRKPDSSPAPVMDPPAEPVPLVVLELSLDAPGEGWSNFLAARGIEIVEDDLGLASITRSDARMLIAERREAEAHAREVAARQEQAAIERDRAFRAALPTGLHWTDIPVGVSAADVWAQQEKDAKPKRRTPLEDALAGDGMIYRPLRPDGNES
jgi:hypothetical protein